LLARFPFDPKPSSTAVDTPTIAASENDVADKAAEDVGTPLDGDTPVPDDKVPADGSKRKSLNGAKTGSKRAAPTPSEDAKQKEKGRPGPKKKPRL